jgi:NAD(P)-dependent dehydrogenase (short-subunit alcohol dehydrogenase family)
MDLGLRDRVVLITGASKGIGKGIALACAREGARVVICARDEGPLEKTAVEIRALGAKVLAVSADVTDPIAPTRVLAQTLTRFQGLDVLINNAGGTGKFANFGELEDEDWRQAYELNVLSIVGFVRAAAPHLKKSRAARIINIASTAGIQPGKGNPHYGAAKAAAINLSKSLANLFAPDGILVHCICPGPVWTDSWERTAKRKAKELGVSYDEAAKLERVEDESAIPLGRLGDPQDVASLTVFLASGQASWMTGSCFRVDGGKVRSML